jgi:hypothetical protein
VNRRGSFTDGERGPAGCHMGDASKRPRGYRTPRPVPTYGPPLNYRPMEQLIAGPRGHAILTADQRKRALYG